MSTQQAIYQKITSKVCKTTKFFSNIDHFINWFYMTVDSVLKIFQCYHCTFCFRVDCVTTYKSYPSHTGIFKWCHKICKHFCTIWFFFLNTQTRGEIVISHVNSTTNWGLSRVMLQCNYSNGVTKKKTNQSKFDWLNSEKWYMKM